MTGVRWVVAGVAAVVAAGLVVVVGVMDLEQGEKIASVAGAVVSVLLAGFTVATAQPAASAGQGRRIRAGRGATVIDGNVTGSALGRGSKVTGPPTAAPAPAPPTGDATPRPPADGVSGGRDSTVILGDVRDSAIGDQSERR
ncbi:hypothetical protein [Streptomyces sp. NPDC048623]|uniref:hypothetical protein n=1 Tax=Streptomyces sp. NPDC048623 TaxID=3155761 RepID=UPI0034492B4D